MMREKLVQELLYSAGIATSQMKPSQLGGLLRKSRLLARSRDLLLEHPDTSAMMLRAARSMVYTGLSRNPLGWPIMVR